MELSGIFFQPSWLVAFALLYIWVLWYAFRWADWRRLGSDGQINVFLGAVVFLMLIWTLRVNMPPGFAWHMSGMVSLTLMFGWSLAIVGGSLTLLGVTLAGLNDWGGYLPSVLLLVVLPASLTQLMLGFARAYLPFNYFIYIYINAFLAGMLVSLVVAAATVALLLIIGAVPIEKLQDGYLLFLPLMLFPEGVLNGWTMSILVGFRPAWVWSFRDEDYINGK